MTSLTALWDASLTLCAIGSLALAALLLARVVARSQRDQRAELRARLLPQLLGAGEEPGPLKGDDLRVAAALTCELGELTRGSDLEALLERAAAMGVPAMLVRWLRARSPQRRLVAVETLGLFEDEGWQVAAALDDRNRDVRLGAALVLARRDDAPDPATLVRKLAIGTKEHSLLVSSLMSDLAARDPDAVAALLFDKDIPYAAKVAATDALADSGGRYVALLASMAQHSQGEPSLQLRVYRALGRTGHPAGGAAILEGLHSADTAVRAAAAEAAGKSGITQAIDLLGRLLDDGDWTVRYRAGEALLRLGPRGLATLWDASQNAEGEARHAASAMLAEARAA
ncbi:MAG: HEAT repeat domain-containing protein [Sphingomonadales bacterium]|nr:HEAT repeat domain-containing protein [Sphingomonadales bacterium]MBD3774148.1 HEAT repeat domain-containing protein [Paracoccaceae bacterium]